MKNVDSNNLGNKFEINIYKPTTHFLHIDKTGGSALSDILIPLVSRGYNLAFHGHDFKLTNLPEGEQFYFGIRNPITRYISGFYSRQRKGQPRNNHEWSRVEKLCFKWFRSPNELAESLYSKNPITRLKALLSIKSVRHINKGYDYWFKDPNYFLKRKYDVLFILRQELLDIDFENLKKYLRIDDVRIDLPKDDISKHKNPNHLSYELSEKAMLNLNKWYKKDFELYNVFIALAQESGWWN